MSKAGMGVPVVVGIDIAVAVLPTSIELSLSEVFDPFETEQAVRFTKQIRMNIVSKDLIPLLNVINPCSPNSFHIQLITNLS